MEEGNTQNSSFHWKPLAKGIDYSVQTSSKGNKIFIGFSGWTVQQSWTNHWIENLYPAKLNELKVKTLFSVKGPVHSYYKNREIETRILVQEIKKILKQAEITVKPEIIVVAHSSGAYVAHEFFNYLLADTSETAYLVDGLLTYFNLDGGIGSEENPWTLFPKDKSSKFKAIYGVYAYDSQINVYSPNTEEMIELGKYSENSKAVLVDVTNSGCQATWCVHETLIIQKPYNSNTFDLEKDYFRINKQHPVSYSYLNVLK